MKPSEEVLAYFYDLADLDENKRFNAIVGILDAFKSSGDYCMERLIGGLASSRAAARLGYTTALTHVLSTFSDDWPAKTLFELTDRKLDSSKAEGSSGVLGRHLLYAAMINSQCYPEVADELVERELIILDKHRYFAMAITQSLAGLAKQLDKATFERSVWSKISNRVCRTLDSITPEWLFFTLLIRDMFPETLKRDVDFFADDGKLSINERNYEDLITILKKTEGCAEGVLARELLSAAREAGTFDLIYVNIVQKWLLNGDVHKVFERLFEFISYLLSKDSLEPTELIVIFSTNFISNLRLLRKAREYRFYAPIVDSIFEKLDKSLSSGKWKRKELLSLLNNIDTTATGNFDEYFRSKLRITEKIIAQLDKKGVRAIISKALNDGGWSIRRIANVFPVWADDLKGQVLLTLAKRETCSEEVHMTLCKCIDSMFFINVRAGRNVRVVLSDENENVLRNVLNGCAKKFKMPNSDNRTLVIFALVLNIWSITSPDEQQRRAYLTNVAEIVSISKKLSHENTKEPFSVLIDLLLSLLSRPYRYHRTLVHFVFASILPQLNIQNLIHIFETLSLPDDEMMVGEKDDEEEDEAGISVDEQDDFDNGDGRNEEHDDTEGSEEKETDSDLESSEGEEDDGEEQVDEEFRGKLKVALGEAAVLSDAEDDDDDKDSFKSTVSDETMFRLDAGLAAVFRERMKGTRKASASTLEQIHQFRMKCFDLLLIVVSHEETTEFTADFVLPLLRLARESLQKKNGEISFNKATSLLEIIVKHRKADISEKKANKLLKKMVAASSQIVNPVLRNLVGTLSSFLFSTAYNVEKQNVSERMRSQMEELLCSYMTQSDNRILSELAMAPFFKYPWVFTSFLPRIIDFAFDEQVRIYRRTEALACAVVFMRKNLAKQSEANEKLWKRVAKKLATHMHTYLSTLNAEDAKPRFLALVIKLLTAFAGIASPERKMQLFEALDSDLDALCENEQLWKTAGKMKRFNSASQTICGRNTLAALKQAKVMISGR